jgi:hypothetical protein
VANPNKLLHRIVAALLLSLAALPTCASGRGSFGKDEPWNHERIDQLPAEVRTALVGMCGDLAAQRYFAGYFDDSRRLVLYFERLRCANQPNFCTQSGCLHQVYISTGAGYRLLKSYHGPRE